jgi:phosphoglycerate dehydrogenase-like enzyme
MNSINPLHQLLILSQHSETYNQLIRQKNLPGLSIKAFGDPDQVLFSNSEYDLVFGEPSLVCRVLNKLMNVKWVQSSWAGVEPLLQPNIRCEYILTNIRNMYGPLMSEYVFGYLLMIERQNIPRWQSQQCGEWDDRPYGILDRKLIGLLGVGTIGAHLASTAKHFGMRVYGYTRQSESCPNVDKYFHGENLVKFTADLDYLVCSLPGTSATRKIIDEIFLLNLPRKAWLVNIGRGSTMDEMALANALNNGSLAGVVLDVFTEEPLPPGHPLWSTPNTFITAHTAARNNPPEIANVFTENYLRFLQGERLMNQVNFELGY